MKTKNTVSKKVHRISGLSDGYRLESRVLEEQIQQAVADGSRSIEVEAYGQHGIGGRLWKAGDDPVHIKITGSPGQRVGSMGFPNTSIEVMGPASDDVGWLNGGAEIIVHGHATNGIANAMAQGTVYIGGSVGARAMTMTKRNPRFAPPELWVLGSVGDYFAEFMAGGITVICGYEPQDPTNVLGYRPCIGMVGGKIFFRGPHKGYSQADAKLTPIKDEEWQWLTKNLATFLSKLGKTETLSQLSNRDEWQLLEARSPNEKSGGQKRSVKDFRQQVWDKELGRGGLIGDLLDVDQSQIPVITNGELRRFVPVWENKKFAAPCEASCPTGMPVHERWRLIREGHMDEAVDIGLAYTPFPATICGYLCPNLCMQGCSRKQVNMTPVGAKQLGQATIKAKTPALPPLSGHKIAVIGGGPAGISLAWQLRLKGHDAVIYDMHKMLGGKIAGAIPDSRIPKEVVEAELERIREVLPHVHLQQKLTTAELQQLKTDFDFVVIAVGASKPRILPVPGKERLVGALDFLRDCKAGEAKVGKKVVIIGAGNVGCDVATEAHRIGAEHITLVDIQQPASFGEERKSAEKIGAQFRWPIFTKEITADGLVTTTGELIAANTVIVSVGDQPDLSFLPDTVNTDRGFVVVNETNQTSDPKIFAIGDAVKLGLLTDAIGSGRKVAQTIDSILTGKNPETNKRKMIDYSRIKLEYFDPRLTDFGGLEGCGAQCSSCGVCRDCGVCVAMCPAGAISRREEEGANKNTFEMIVDSEKCIGCGFCAGACPCGVWNIIENSPLW